MKNGKGFKQGRLLNNNKKEVILMKKRLKMFLIIAGIISLVLGVTGAVPSFLRQMYGVAIASVGLIIVGLALLGYAFSD